MQKTDSIAVYISVKDKNGKTVIKQVRAEIKQTGDQAKKSTDKMQKGFGDLWKKMAAGAAIVALLTKLTLATVGFENSFANVTTLLPKGTANIKQLEQQLLNLPPALGDIKTLTEAAYNAISGSVEPVNAVKFVGDTAKFAKANMVEMGSAVDLLTTILNTYGDKAGSAAEITDVLTTTIRLGKTRGVDLANKLGQLAGTANTVGISFKDLNAAVIALTAGGVKTSEAMTSLKAIISNIAAPTTKALEAARGLAGGFSIASLKSQGLATFLQNLVQHVGHNTQKMIDLFGSVEAFNAIAVMTSSVGIKKFTSAQKELANSLGATEEAYNKQRETFSAAMSSVVNTAERAIVKVLLPIFRDVAAYLRANGEQVQAFIAKVANAISYIGKILGVAIRSASEIVAVLSNAFDAVFSVITGVLDTFGFFAKETTENVESIGNAFSTALTPINAIIPGFSNICNALSRFEQKIKNVNPQIETMGDVLKSLTAPLTDLRAAIVLVGEAFLTYWALAKLTPIFAAINYGILSMQISMATMGVRGVTAISSVGAAFKGLGAVIRKIPKTIWITVAIVGAIQAGKILAKLYKQKSDVEDLQMSVINREAETADITTKRFNSLRDALSLSRQQLKGMREDFSGIEDRGIRMNKIMQAIRKGRYGEAMAEQFKTWASEQKTVHDGMIMLGGGARALLLEYRKNKSAIMSNKDAMHEFLHKINEASAKAHPAHREALKKVSMELLNHLTIFDELAAAAEEARKAYEALAQSMGVLTDTGMRGLSKESNILEKILLKEKGAIVGNWEAIDKIKAQIDAWISSYQRANKVIPPALKQISDEYWKIVYATRELSKNVVIPDVKEDPEWYLDALLGEGNAEEKMEKLRKTVENLPKPLNESAKSAFNLGEAFRIMAEFTGKAIASMVDLGIIGERTASFLNSFVNAIGGIGSGIEQIQKANDAIKNATGTGQKFLGWLGKIGGYVSIATTAISFLGNAISSLFGSTLISDSVGKWNVSEDLAKKIEEMADSLAGKSSSSKWNAAEASISTFFDEIIRQSDVTVWNFDRFVNRTRDILGDLDRGMLSSSETVDALGRAFGALAEKGRELGTLGGREYWKLINDVRDRGLNVPEIESFMVEAQKEGVETYKAVNQFVLDGQNAYNDLIEEAQKALDEGNREEAAKLNLEAVERLKEISGLSGLSVDFYNSIIEYDQKVADNKGLFDYISNVETAFLRLGEVKQLTQDDMNQFNLAASQSFEKLLEQNFTPEEAYKKMKPIFEKLLFYEKEWGLTIDDNTRAIINQGLERGYISEDFKTEDQKRLESNQLVIDAMDRLTKTMLGIPLAAGEMASLFGEEVDGMVDDVGLFQVALDDLSAPAIVLDFEVGDMPNLGGGGNLDLDIGGVPHLAEGGTFTTEGPALYVAGDNPSGRERVTVTPLDEGEELNRNGSAPVTINVYGVTDYESFIHRAQNDSRLRGVLDGNR